MQGDHSNMGQPNLSACCEHGARVHEPDPLPAGPVVPFSQKAANGQPCPLAGMDAGKNTKCPLTRKAFKSCCGKKVLKG